MESTTFDPRVYAATDFAIPDLDFSDSCDSAALEDPRSPLHRIVEDTVVQCTRELYRTMQIALAVGPAKVPLSAAVPAADCNYLDPCLPVHAICGFHDEEMSGDIVLRLDPALLERSLPVEIVEEMAHEADRLLWDWARETANQLTGRFKNELHAFGRMLRLTPPVNLPCYDHGARKHLEALPPFIFRSAYGQLTVFVSLKTADSLGWEKQDVEVAAAGELLFFD